MSAASPSSADRSSSAQPSSAKTSFGGASLKELLRRGAARRDLEAHLDGLPVRERLEQVLDVTGKDVARLYDAVAGAPTLALTDLVPEGEKGTVILEGRNSLPILVSRFQKRFAWVQGTLVGYNHQTFAPVTGPGYFVVRSASGKGDHGDELYFDYTATPPGSAPGWPTYKANDRGLSRLVYANMLDYCRRVATGVLVGKAYKNGVAQNAWFTLTSAR